MPAHRVSNIDRFYKKVQITDDCWLWIGGLNIQGYSVMKIFKKSGSAHRFSYEYFKGLIPEGLQIDHLCRVKRCVNPDHLEAVTSHANIMRSEGVAAVNAKKINCINGHVLPKKNTSLGRDCKICRANRLKKYKEQYE